MTIEEAMSGWLAIKQKRDAKLYEAITVIASPSYAYSSLTFESFSCLIHFTYDGKEDVYDIGEDEVAEFLNWVWGQR